MSPNRPAQHILVVEDDPATREAMRIVLEWEGYCVDVAADGCAALEQLQAGERPTVILMDLNMPRMDGRELRQRIQGDPRLASIPVITISAAPDADQIDGFGLVRKPFVPSDLLNAVHLAEQTGQDVLPQDLAQVRSRTGRRTA
jgi:CheY-like chemotaxis protein